MRVHKRHLILMIAALLIWGMAVGNAGFSSESISMNSTGEYGDDDIFAGNTEVFGEQISGEGTNTLYVGAQAAGYDIVGGCVYSIAVSPGADSTGHYDLYGSYHVLLDPAGPKWTGCEGTGWLDQ